MAEAEKKGIEEAGGKADIYQYVDACVHIPAVDFFYSDRVAETLSEDILSLLKAPPRPDYPTISPDILATYDAFLMGIPTRYGNMPVQWKVRYLILLEMTF